ncbi:putative repeat protein (TIGR01451 family)/fimbrial isopeptide formation D2 family protein [Lysobacter niastensis]|uniref:Repeat protein (TIGR01451 family)/fimbrial isopeptide formation D2 family protein n=1 Tax=Lysobacter niastensis TaxID=380629 RepID=A0ABU1WBR2_9GAMM|nr:isopeptide-forming domain-containing fimbrial protein [Lysobacter niastensis]MDR7134989.1 putative repeat protein (TIGR01451 family)/fimbrial isopeptide formation D2 family protein [Lysobacter niastensis]
MSLGFARTAGAGKSWIRIQLFAFLMLFGTAFGAYAADCVADFGGVVDGNVVNPAPSNLNIDGNCIIRNFQQPNPLDTNISFFTQPGQTDARWLVVFDNVDFTLGNIACDAVHQHKIWFVNGSLHSLRPNCQNFLVPVESINKQGPAYAAVGVPFTYRLRVPILIDPSTGTEVLNGVSQNDLHGITLYDNIGADPVTVYVNGLDDNDPSTPPVQLPVEIPGTGVDLSLVGTPSVRWCVDLACQTLGAAVNPTIVANPNGLIEFKFAPGFIIPQGGRLAIDITVVLDDNSSSNVLGKAFVNTAIWQFGRLIDGTFYNPLPGENGVSAPTVIAGPNLVVNKTGTAVLGGSTLNLGEWGEFTVDAVNTGQFDAWNVTLLDRLPDGPTGGMCDMTPEITGVQLGGTLLTQGVHYTLSYTGAPTCELSLTLLDAAGSIAPGEHLVLEYRTKLDADTQNGATITNVAGATRWYNDSSVNPARVEVTRALTNGTVGTDDHEDAHSLAVLLSGYFYEKTVRNVTTGESPAATAAPGDVLHYTLRLQATDSGFDDVIFRDQLPPDFVAGSLVFTSLPAGAVNNSNPATGFIDIRGLDVPAGGDVRVEFNVTLLSTLANAHMVVNQAQLLSSSEAFLADSDDPNVNGQADPDPAVDDEDPTRVRIGAPPSPPTKVLVSPTNGEATIGEELVYRIAVPGQPRSSPMYDVQVTDALSANLEYVSATATVGGVVNGPGVVNSSTASQVAIAIDQVPAGLQAFVDVRVRVRNVLGAQQGVDVGNTASFTYSESDGGAREPALATNQVFFNIVEPTVTIAKAANRTTAAANDLIRYTVTLTAASGNDASGALDVSLTDTLGVGLQYAGNPVVTGTGNTIGAPVVTGDGSAGAPQTLVWSLGDGNADIDIAEGESIQVSYDVRVRSDVLADQDLTNTAVARWTGIDGANAGERTGADGPGQLNDYVTAPASTTVTTPGARPSKQLSSPATGGATIGQEVTYTILVPSAPSSATLFDVAVTDALDANLELAAVTVTGVAGATTGSSTASQMNVLIPQIPAGQQATIELRARVRNILSAQQGVQVSNTASYTYAVSPGGTVVAPLASAAATFTIVEPAVAVAKTGDKTGANGGDIVRYTVTVTAAGDANASDAFDLRLVDTLASGLTYVGNPTVTGIGNSIGAPLITGDGSAGNPYVLSWSTAAGNAAINVAKAASVQVSYDVRVNNGVAALTTLANSVLVEWSGIAGVSAFERNGAGCPTVAAPNDYCAGPASHSVLTNPPRLNFTKTVVSQTPAHPGDVVQYRLQLSNLSDVSAAGISLVDELDALNDPAKFVPGTLALVGTLPVGAVNNSNASGGAKGTGRIDIGNLTLGAAGSGSETVVVEYRVQLVPVIANGTVVLNQARAQFGNTLLALSDDPTVNGQANPDVSGDEDPTRLPIESAPQLVVEKVSAYLGTNPNVLMAGDTLRYTITVRNIGNDHAHGVILRDLVPANTAYVAGSTALNGVAAADGPNGSPLINGITVSSPAETTAGVVRADNPANAAANVATITFNVIVDPNAADGTIVANQAFVMATDLGNEAPSDDPRTPVANDPTRDVVGNAPLLYAEKAVALRIDNTSPGVIDPLDTLRYTIRIYNNGRAAATQLMLRDNVPQHTSWVADSLTLNGQPVGQPDGGVSPLIAGINVGTINPGQSVVVQFDVQVNAGTAGGTLIANQATVAGAGLAPLLTDGDGNPSTGPEPTVVVVGAAQAMTINKQVAVVGGGAALPGAGLEYVVIVRNVSPVPATLVRIVDDLAASAAGQLVYVAGSATLNGSSAGITVSGATIVADYFGSHGDLAPGASATLRFRATIASGLASGTRVTNTGVVSWSDPAQTASASVAFDVGGMIGVGVFSGRAWHDANFNRTADAGERVLAGWSVQLYRNGQLERTTTTDADGEWRISGVAPNDASSDALEVRFTAPGATASTAKLGYAHSVFGNDLQRIHAIAVQPGSNLLNLNLPIEPNGVIYEAMNRVAIAGARLRLLDAAGVSSLPATCFADPAQQGQVTQQGGFYRFDLNFTDPACPSGGSYLIEVAPPSADYLAGPSGLMPPSTGANNAAFSVPNCPAGASDAIPGTTERCEAQVSELAPPTSVPARSAGTTYYLHLRMDDTFMPGSSQIFNNHIPLDLDLGQALAISKTTPMKNVTRGQLVPYTITLRNLSGLSLRDVRAVDSYPAGFKYVPGSARIDNVPTEPGQSGRQLTWSGLEFRATDEHVITLLLAVGAGVGEGEFVNRARVWNGLSDRPLSGEATATVRVVPDPTFDCTDIIGKVFDDANRNGHQDEGEGGLGGVRLVSARGLAATTDANGRYHLTCAVVPNEDRGSNFVLKLDDRTLPSGYRPSTRQTVIARATRGKALSIDFGASVFRVVSLDLSDEVFERGGTQLRRQWQPRVQTLLDELVKEPAVLRLSYLADLEDPDLVEARLAAIKAQVTQAWPSAGASYPLTVEQQTFWRRGAPVQRPVGNEGARK